MAKTYRIIYQIDDSQARATTQRSIRGAESIESATRRAAATQEREARRLDAIQDRLVRSDYTRRVQFERQKVLNADRAARQATAAQEHESRKLDAIQDRLVRRDYSRKVQYERRKIEESERQAERSAAKAEQMVIGGAAALAGAALVGLQALNDGYAKIREDALTAAEATLKLKSNLRVEATLKGVGGNQAIRESIAFRAATGLGEQEATEFTKQYLGTVPIARQKGNITPKVEEELMVQAGIMAARQGGDAGTKGELAGILGQFAPVNTAEEGLNQLEAIRIALTEGRGDDSPLTQQLLKAAGSIVREGGVIKSLPEMAALIGVTSLAAGEEESSTRAKQLVRGLRVGLSKQTTAMGTEVSQGEYLASLGITEADDLESSLDRIMPDLMKAREAGRDLDVYLTGKNFRSQEERQALIETIENYEPFKKRMAASRAVGQGAGAMKANQEFLRSEEGQAALARVGTAAAEVTLGAPNQRALAGLEVAAAHPEMQEANKSLMGMGGDIMRGIFSGNVMHPIDAGRRMRIEAFAESDLERRAREAGVPDEDIRQARFDAFQEGGGQLDIGEFTNRMQGMIKSHGGDAGVNLAPILQKLNGTLDSLDATLGAPPRAPAALGKPQGGPVRIGQ